VLVHVVPVEWSRYRDQLRWLREQVFVIEQSVPRELEWDGQDEASSHFLALNEAGQPLGCARLLPTGQIGRMAVLQEQRGHGLGMRLLIEAIEHAKRLGFTRVTLHAQTHAAGFYRKAGFLPFGDEFMEAGIPHQEMALELPIPFESPGIVPGTSIASVPVIRSEAADTDTDSRVEHYRGESACREGLLRCLDQPARKLHIFSPLLDHQLFDFADTSDAISRFARSGAHTQIRILITDSRRIVDRGHRLVELARRLPSKITIRKVPAELDPGSISFVTWDDTGFLLMPDFREYAAVVARHDRVQAERFSQHFAYLWEHAAPDPDLKTLTV
jgi:predicted GNAT family N-acyltransferase